ncbi:hypothetical protein [Leisingera methylohalidivorans]|nr:hypothetical protein [Leisingera methylohalidivorans]
MFIALNPFLRLSGHPPWQTGDWTPESAARAAKEQGPSCGVSWQEIADLCGLPSVRHVNRALRLTGSKQISSEFACPEDTEKMLSVCASHSVHPPDEGCSSPLLELSMGAFARDLGLECLIGAGHFGVCQSPLHTKDLLNKQQDCDWVELWPEDLSLFCTIYTDYHYYLICQTSKSLQKARPENYFEGFYAGEETSDFWGVGNLAIF